MANPWIRTGATLRCPVCHTERYRRPSEASKRACSAACAGELRRTWPKQWIGLGLEALPSHIWNRVEPEPNTGCWLWTGVIAGGGYGYVAFGAHVSKAWRAHRLFYAAEHGEVPAGLDLDHLCRVRTCVNPDHLEPVTRSENVLRGFRSRRMEASHA